MLNLQLNLRGEVKNINFTHCVNGGFILTEFPDKKKIVSRLFQNCLVGSEMDFKLNFYCF